jgi:hypothetical protein
MDPKSDRLLGDSIMLTAQTNKNHPSDVSTFLRGSSRLAATDETHDGTTDG